jgi:hypothetical protein
MKNNYQKRQLKGRNVILLAAILIAFMQFPNNSNAQKKAPTTQDCSVNYFSAEITDQQMDDNCVTRTVAVHVSNGNKYALSHFVIEVPSCGEITQASNTGGWPIKMNSTDPKSGIYGLKVDEISTFGDGGIAKTFYVTYTTCSEDAVCLKSLQEEPFRVVYKAATCQFTDTLTPVLIAPLTATITPQAVLCYNSSTGSVTTQVLTGTAPYQYLWNTGATTSSITDVKAGTYQVTITDANNQQITLSAEVTQPTALTLTGSSTATACNQPTGTITPIVNGGTAPYNYSWSDGSTDASRTAIATGVYSLKVTDNNGCTQSRTYTVVQNSSLNATLSGSSLECHQKGQGTVTTNVYGGTAPYKYTWSTGDTTQNINNLTTGRYQVTITDQQGCTTTKGAYVTIRQLAASALVTTPHCKGDSTGTATLKILNGTAPYTILWNTGDTTSTISNVAAGWYSASITDANGCQYNRTVNIAEPLPLNIKATMTRESCNPEDSTVNVTLSGSGGTAPYTWNVNDTISTTSFQAQLNDVLNINMSDAWGCNIEKIMTVTASAQSIVINKVISQPNCTSPFGQATLTATGGLAPYTIQWSDGNDEFSRDSLIAGTYTANIYDAKGCSNATSFDITAITHPSVAIIAPESSPLCETSGNLLSAVTNNVVSSDWQMISGNNSWVITSETINDAIYNAGTGNASVILTGKSTSGCIASDTIFLACTTQPTDTTTTEPGTNGPCNFFDSYTASLIDMTADEYGCVNFKFNISTDGKAEHELSNMVIGIGEGQLQDVSINRSWPVEKNITDPKSGVFGFKVDNINGFGQSGNDSFEVDFTVCYGNTIPETFSFPVVFKAATCHHFDTLTIAKPEVSGINLTVHPNPFVDNCYFEVTSKTNTNVEINIFDSKGTKVQTLCNTNIVKGLTYQWIFNGAQSCDVMFFYQLISPLGNKEGKLIRVK